MVEIEFENFIFTVNDFGKYGEEGLSDFSSNGSTSVFEKSVFDELLSDGRASFKTLTSKGFKEGAKYALNV